MVILVLGIGLQGRAVVHDLEQGPLVDQIVAADLDEHAERGAPRIGLLGAECSGKSALAQALAQTLDGMGHAVRCRGLLRWLALGRWKDQWWNMFWRWRIGKSNCL